MAWLFNFVTGKMEEVPSDRPLAAPLSGRLVDTAPDDVKPEDLVVGNDPRRPYGKPLLGSTEKITTTPGAAPARLASGEGMIPLVPPPGDGWAGTTNMDIPAVDPGSPEDQPPPAPPPAAPAAKPAGGGGGGGGPAAPAPGQLTAGETVAQGGLQTAQDEEAAALKAQGEVEVRKNEALAKQAEAQAGAVAAAQEAWQKKRDQAEKHLQEREDAASKVKLKDVFEGRPLAALVAALAAGIGARAAAITGTENTALRVLDAGAKAYREKQQIEYERELKGIDNEKDRLQYATMQAAADEAGLYRRFEMERTKLLLSYGADEARVKSDFQIAAFRSKQAEIQAARATMLYERGRAEVLQAAQVSQMRASASAAYAQAEQTRAETEAIKAGGGSPGRPAPVEAQKEVAALSDGLNTIERALQFDDATFREVGSNMVEWNRKQALDKTPGTKQFRSLAQAVGWADVAPEQGLRSDKGRELHQSIQRVLTSAAKEYGGVITEGDRDAAASELAAAGANPQAFRRALANIGSRWAMKREQYMRNNNIRTAEAPGGPAAAAPTTREWSEAIAWANKNKNDPRAASILAARGR